MAQYFYDFKDMIPSDGSVVGPATGLTRLMTPSDSSDYQQQFSKAPTGVDVWQKTPPGGDTSKTFSWQYMFGPKGVRASDVECLVKMVTHQYNGPTFTNAGPAFFARLSGPDLLWDGMTSYELAFEGPPTGTTTFFRKRVGGVATSIGGGDAPNTGIARDVPVWLRFQITGQTLRLRAWLDGVAEPSTWNRSETDSSISAAGAMAFGIPGASGNGYGTTAGTRFRLYQLSFGTNGDPAPATNVKNVSGKLLTPTGQNAAGYIVRCYSQKSGVLLGETLTSALGIFTFEVSISEAVYCVGVDQLGNTWKAPIMDRILPI